MKWSALTYATTFASSSSSGATPSDPLAALSDTFDGSDSITARGWSVYSPGVLGISEVASGRYRHSPALGGGGGSFWFNTSDGYLVYRGDQEGNEIVGDCDLRIRQVVQFDTFDSLPQASQFRIAGIAVHDPDRSANFNYTHIGAGHAGAGYRVETKNTVSSASVFPTAVIAPTHPWTIDVRLVRTGDDIVSYYRQEPVETLASNDSWITHITNTRADFPESLQWGLICYANPADHNIGTDVEEVLFATP